MLRKIQEKNQLFNERTDRSNNSRIQVYQQRQQEVEETERMSGRHSNMSYSANLSTRSGKRRKIRNSMVLDSMGFKVDANRVSGTDNPQGKIVKNHRTVILGAPNVGKTSLFLRYMYFDRSKKIEVQQTPEKDGHIFKKRIPGKQYLHEYEIWDFLNKDELIDKKKGKEEYNVLE